MLASLSSDATSTVEPEWSVLFDIDADMVRRTREKLLDELEGTDVAVAPPATNGAFVR